MARESSSKGNLFEREANIYKASKKVLANEESTSEEIKEELTSILVHYGDLLDQSKLITKVSDRLQKKINKAYDDLESTNSQLQEMLDALTKAKVGRRATTIVLIIFIGLFLVMEGWLEPMIDMEIADHEDWKDYSTAIALSMKGVMALLLRPVEKLVEKFLLKQAQREKEKELKANLEGDNKAE